MTEASIVSIAVPSPFFEGVTNVYAIVAEPLTLIDTGIGTDEAFQALDKGLRSHGLALAALKRIVLTHHHLDHFGLAHRVREHSGAQVSIHEADWEAVAHYEDWHHRFVDRLGQCLLDWGVPKASLQEAVGLLTAGGPVLGQSVPAERLTGGQCLPMGDGALEVLHVPGHSRGSICLRYGRLLFSGDHVLPNITPNIGGGEPGTAGMLRRYLESLDKVKPLQTEDLLVYPGHGTPFTNLAARAQAIQEHHREREEAILNVLRRDGPKTVYEIAIALFKKLAGYHVALGSAEVHAHLDKLASDQRVTKKAGRYGIP